jgi:exopolysaccharide biosynthesis polyprenyl glycosylphosphotransferase
LFALVAIASFTVHSDLSRGYVLAILPTTLALAALGRRQLRRRLYRLRLLGHGLQRVLVIGRQDAVGHLIERFRHEPWHGLVAVGACVVGDDRRDDRRGDGRDDGRDDRRDDRRDDGLNRPPPIVDSGSIIEAVDRLGATMVAVASHPDLSGQSLRRLAWALEEREVDLVVSPGIIEVAGPRLSIRPVAGLSLLHLERPTTRGGRMIFKLAFDRALGAVLFALCLPLMATTAVAIRLTSPGPALFRQTRIGADGEPFTMLKFRSMVIGAESMLAQLEAVDEGAGLLFKIKHDPRMTPVGKFLRHFSLDELPQLWNVVRGEMSLVGPRPPLPHEVAGYCDDAVRRLRVRPGLTGLWQVSGRSDLSWEESLRLDLRYVDNWSIMLDLTILWRTLSAVLSRRGAY